MEIIIGFSITLLMEISKIISKKYGKEIGSKAIRCIVFSISLIVTILLSTEIVSKETFESVIITFGIAIGFYESIIKRI